MNDEPERFTPPRPAIPVRTKQEQRVADAEAEAPSPQPDIMRSIRARKAWQTRRANRTVKSTPKPRVHDGQVYDGKEWKSLPDRHRPAVFTAKEAVELAWLMVDYPFLRKLVE